MDKRKGSDEELERLVRDALLRAANERWEAELANVPTDGPMPGSPAHLRWESRFLKDPFRRAGSAARPRWQKVLRTAAAAALAAALTLGSALAVSPQLRAWVTEWYQAHISYRFTTSQSLADLQPGDWYIADLPAGYVETERDDGYALGSVRYEKDPDHWIDFTYGPMTQGVLIDIDREDMEITDTTVLGLPAQLYQATTEKKMNTILVFDEANAQYFAISTWENTDTLITMAESISSAG